jgi:hypothetical protein
MRRLENYGGLIGLTVCLIPIIIYTAFLLYHYSVNIIINVLHVSVFAASNAVFFSYLIKSQRISIFWEIAPFLAGYFLHSVLVWIDKGKIYFEWSLAGLIIPYFFIILFGGAFIPIYINRIRRKNIRRTGIDAQAVIKKAERSGTTLTENGERSYKVKLKLRVEALPGEPFEVTDYFWIPAVYSHLVEIGKPFPVKIDRYNRRKIVLNFYKKQKETRKYNLF